MPSRLGIIISSSVNRHQVTFEALYGLTIRSQDNRCDHGTLHRKSLGAQSCNMFNPTWNRVNFWHHAKYNFLWRLRANVETRKKSDQTCARASVKNKYWFDFCDSQSPNSEFFWINPNPEYFCQQAVFGFCWIYLRTQNPTHIQWQLIAVASSLFPSLHLVVGSPTGKRNHEPSTGWNHIPMMLFWEEFQ